MGNEPQAEERTTEERRTTRLPLGRRGAEDLRCGQAEPGFGGRFNVFECTSRKRWKAIEERNAAEKGFAFCSFEKTTLAAVGRINGRRSRVEASHTGCSCGVQVSSGDGDDGDVEGAREDHTGVQELGWEESYVRTLLTST